MLSDYSKDFNNHGQNAEKSAHWQLRTYLQVQLQDARAELMSQGETSDAHTDVWWDWRGEQSFETCSVK